MMESNATLRLVTQMLGLPHVGGSMTLLFLKSGGLNGSMQHLLGVYWPEFQSPKFFLDVD
jgi:hypothetical protein